MYVIRASVELRNKLATNNTILERLAEIDRNLLGHDSVLQDIYEKLLPLLAPPPEMHVAAFGFALIENTASSTLLTFR